MKKLLKEEKVTGIPDTSRALILSSRDHKLLHGHGKGPLFKQMSKLGKKADVFARSIREQVRLSPKISETLKGKVSLGARILQVGGTEKAFRKLFDICEKKRLLKASNCYLSTTAGPIEGLLFISTRSIAFCSEKSLKLSRSSGESIRVHYKALIPLSKIETAKPSENA